MHRLLQAFLAPVTVPARYFFWGGLLAVLFTGWVMQTQLGNRWSFAGAELRRDVMDRWGAPIDQPAPSARFVESGSVFSTLKALAFDSQTLDISASMNYRKRGLVYFSGFEFGFDGRYELVNPEPKAIDVVFVFPIQSDRNRILLSDLEFSVNDTPETIPLHAGGDKLVWTGRIQPDASVAFRIQFRGQGLDRFRYILDPGLGARNVDFKVTVTGDKSYDYPPGVVPAHEVVAHDDAVQLHWKFSALESGVPIGLVLPSQTSFDEVIVTMARRAWVTYALFFAVLVILTCAAGRAINRVDAYFVAALYSFFFVLLPYLAAYMNFYFAYLLSTALIGALLHACIRRITGAVSPIPLALIGGLLVLPTAAVISEEHTGLIYCMEILAALAALSVLIGKPHFRVLLAEAVRVNPSSTQGDRHDAA